MLKISEVLSCRKVTVEVDEYIPLTVCFDSEDVSSPIYWRGGDGRFSLIEIGLSKKTGVISSINLITIPSGKVHSDSCSLQLSKYVEGAPAFDTTDWPKGNNFSDGFLKDFSSEFNLLIGVNFVSLFFESSKKVNKNIKNLNINFGFSDEGELLSIDFLELTEQQISILLKEYA